MSFLSFKEARILARSLNFKNTASFHAWLSSENKPNNFPSNPHHFYASQWRGFPDFLGNENTAPYQRDFWDYESAKKWVHELNLKTFEEWRLYCTGHFPDLPSKPANIPSNPQLYYDQHGWVNISDWLGSGGYQITPPPSRFLDFEEARNYVIKLNIKTFTEWREYVQGKHPTLPNRPPFIPSNPHSTYKNKGWINYGHWLGTNSKANFKKEFLPFREARSIARTLGLKTMKEWRTYLKENPTFDESIPRCPDKYYKSKGWKGYRDFLS